MADTRFTETEALLAVLADDAPKAAQLLERMLPGELIQFQRSVHQLESLIARAMATEGPR